MTAPEIGIEAMDAYCGVAKVSTRMLFEERGLLPSRYDNLMMDERSVQMPWEDPVTNGVNAARRIVENLETAARNRIELLITATESGLDYSKSIASYVHHYLGLPRACRVLEVKQACYGTTGALQLAAAGLSPGAKALVIATDVNPMDAHAQYAETTTGHGAVALLLGDEPGILALDRGAYGITSFETMDTARPRPDFDLYHADLSLLTYLECLGDSFRAYRSRVPDADIVKSFDYLAMHTPFAGMVKAAHRKVMREFAPRPPAAVAEDFEARVLPSLGYARTVGNLCSGSIYLALASIIDSEPASATDGAKVGFYSYGSGCASEFFSGRIADGAAARLAALSIGPGLAIRLPLDFPEYERVLPAAKQCLVPRADHQVDLTGCDGYLEAVRSRGPVLVLRAIDNYHRRYEWR